MKWFIASDLHGSYLYCEKMLEAFRREGADRILLLGDILYHGPRNGLPEAYDPKKVIDMLNPLADRIVSVRGNCDAEVDQVVLQFPIMADYMMLQSGARTVIATHGHIYNMDHLPPLPKGTVLLHGHTHVQVCQPFGDYVYVNPGSVTFPKQDSVRGYIVLEDGRFTWKDLDGNVLPAYAL